MPEEEDVTVITPDVILANTTASTVFDALLTALSLKALDTAVERVYVPTPLLTAVTQCEYIFLSYFFRCVAISRRVGR